MTAISLSLSQGFSTLHDIDAFRCSVAEISDYLASNKRLIVLIISAFRSSCPIGPHFPPALHGFSDKSRSMCLKVAPEDGQKAQESAFF